jgi:soluble lytic murein transglycosylase
LSAPAYFNHIRFGAYYSDLVMPLAENYGFHALFLYALIRQESLFEGFVNSSAGARGLMQIMPATGTEIAGNLGWPENYTEDDLFRPLVSLRYGVDYLDRQRKLFDGNLYAALAAYNGGPGNAQEWLELALDDPDLFLEVIRYDETRNYLRRIYENFNIYRLIYNRTP